MNQLKEKYEKEIRKAIQEEFSISNVMAIPKIQKIVVNAGIGKEFTTNSNVVEEFSSILAQITGLKPVVVNSKKSISNFKLREGTPNGLKVTLRGEMMWDFLDKLINVTLPRIKDFRGVSRNSFDVNGSSYTLGIKEHTIFPEIDTSTFSKIRSMQVVIVTSSRDRIITERLLEKMGMPFVRKKIKKDN